MRNIVPQPRQYAMLPSLRRENELQLFRRLPEANTSKRQSICEMMLDTYGLQENVTHGVQVRGQAHSHPNPNYFDADAAV